MPAEEGTFICPNCGSRYKVVRIENQSAADDPELACVCCGAALQAVDGKFALKYFLVGPSSR